MKTVRIIHCAHRICTRFASFPTLADSEKADTQFSEQQVHCPEERPKAQMVENYQYTSVPMGIRLKLFFAQLFLLISSVSTKQSQICVMNTGPVLAGQSDPLFEAASLLMTTPTPSTEVPAQEDLLQKYKERVERFSQPSDRNLYGCTIPDHS